MKGAEWVVREGVGAGGEMTQAMYVHMNNKTIKKRNIHPTKTTKVTYTLGLLSFVYLCVLHVQVKKK
jgi:hypothetical protein